MSFNSIGDLASSLMLSQSNLQAKRAMTRLSQELTTGLTSDVGSTLRNDFSAQMSWERSIMSSQVREKTLSEAMTRIVTKQNVLGSITDSASSLANDMNLALASGTPLALDAVSGNAKTQLEQALSRLNTQIAGRTLFAGAQTNGSAVAPLDDIMTSVKAGVAGAVTVSDITTAVQDWMDDASGFQAIAYLGSDDDAGTIRLSSDRTIIEGVRADDPAIKEALQHLILASLASDDDLGLSRESKIAVIEHSANGLRAAEGKITALHASLGYIEAEIADGVTRAGAEISTAELLRVETLGIDQYETASKLQEAELQLQKIYMLTARSAQMSLLEYL